MRKPQIILHVFAGLTGLSSLNALAADSYKTVNISLPIVSFDREAVTKFDFNLKGAGALGVELAVRSEAEVFTKSEIEEKNGESLMMKGAELAITYSQFGNPKMMSGGFWGLGLGYRRIEADWQRGALGQDEGGIGLSETSSTSELKGNGVTGHARVGYRYVAESVPLSVGAYIGLRHFQNKLEDKAGQTAEVQEEEMKSLERRFMSQLEPGIEVGLAF